ncbi:hypothetical protein AAMO2058_000239500 [Amorphochlora amoebiformis]|eukprot:859274-Amorphochlora_amoeboformis.AAC.1
MDIEAYSTLNDSSLIHLVDIFFALDKLAARPRRKALDSWLAKLGLARKCRLRRTITLVFRRGYKRRWSREDRLASFVSSVSFVLKEVADSRQVDSI